MNRFVNKALAKIGQLDQKQIVAIIKDLNSDEEKLEAAIESMREGVVLVSSNHEVEFISKNCRNLIPLFPPSRKRDGWEGMMLDDVIDSKELLSYVDECLRARHPGKDEFDYPWGESVKTIRARVEYGETLLGSFLIILEDVTEKNLKEAKLHQCEYLASMTTMAASVAHEIKNPLAGMKIYLDLMNRKLKKNGSITLEASKQYLDVLYEEIDRLNSIVVDYLFAVRPMNVILRLQDLEPTIRETVDFVMPELAQHHVRIHTVFKSSVTRIAFDAEKIKQVLLNLIRNAMAAMPHGGDITLSLDLDGDSVVLDVGDTGCGIKAEDLGKIFEPYFTTKGDKGTGLGLTIVYKIMKEHHGDVTVSSKWGEGTVFHLFFPVPEEERLRLAGSSQEIDGSGEEVK